MVHCFESWAPYRAAGKRWICTRFSGSHGGACRDPGVLTADGLGHGRVLREGYRAEEPGGIYVAIRANGGDDRGLPVWEGKGHDDRKMLEKLRSAGVCGWKLCTPVYVPLYRRKRGKAFEVFAVMRVQRVLHTAFLAEILQGGMR